MTTIIRTKTHYVKAEGLSQDQIQLVIKNYKESIEKASNLHNKTRIFKEDENFFGINVKLIQENIYVPSEHHSYIEIHDVVVE